MNLSMTPEREKALEQAQEKAAKAKEFIDKAQALRLEMLEFINPHPGHFTLRKQTKAEKRKDASLDDVLRRVQEKTNGPQSLKDRWRWADEQQAQQQKKVEDAAKQQDKDRETQALTDESIAYLIGEGLTIGKDFTAANAIEAGLEHAVNKEINRRVTANKPEYLKSQCSECSEWSPAEHRCSCGNRRMYYESEGKSFKDFYIYPAAN